jgi:hypothetical protein
VLLITAIPSVVAAKPGILIPQVCACPARDLRTVTDPLSVRPKVIPRRSSDRPIRIRPDRSIRALGARLGKPWRVAD